MFLLTMLTEALVRFLSLCLVMLTSAWDLAPRWKKKKEKSACAKKKIREPEASQEVVFPPSLGDRSVRFPRRYFSYLTPFFSFCFFPSLRSLVPGYVNLDIVAMN